MFFARGLSYSVFAFIEVLLWYFASHEEIRRRNILIDRQSFYNILADILRDISIFKCLEHPRDCRLLILRQRWISPCCAQEFYNRGIVASQGRFCRLDHLILDKCLVKCLIISLIMIVIGTSDIQSGFLRQTFQILSRSEERRVGKECRL